jgi:hypothetical protein
VVGRNHTHFAYHFYRNTASCFFCESLSCVLIEDAAYIHVYIIVYKLLIIQYLILEYNSYCKVIMEECTRPSSNDIVAIYSEVICQGVSLVGVRVMEKQWSRTKPCVRSFLRHLVCMIGVICSHQISPVR